MSQMVARAGLSVAGELASFMEDQALPRLPILADTARDTAPVAFGKEHRQPAEEGRQHREQRPCRGATDAQRIG